ncbi:MAG: BACON domain-containing protein [Paludibacteraceae bacterium]|nr:BACON domain-containing protein [Paludibacteraceae bacterium]MBR2165329.1 BACON domain-containing protein [Paludibacteraceae bacterium]
MKKLFYLLLIVPMVLMGCKKGAKDAEPETPEAVKLSVTPNSIISPSIGADYSLTLTAPESWTASCADSWVKINPTSGNAGTIELSVKIAADKTSTEASSTIVFKSGDQTVEVPVKRLAKDPARLMVVSETEIKTPKDGGVYTVKVESNIKWQIASNVSWATIDGEAVKRNNAVITVNVNANTMPEETVGTITVTPLEGSGVEKQTVTITRSSSEATSMTIDKNQIDAPSDGGSYSITVNTTAQWIATKSWEADWLTLSDNQQTGNGSFTIKVDPATSSNNLSTVVTITEVRSDDYQPVQLNVLVTRKGKAGAELSVEPTSISAAAQGGDFTVTIKSNYAWTASIVGAKIFSTSINKGDGDATMVVSVKPATDTDPYEATGSITIYSSYGGLQQTIHIHREGLKVKDGKDIYFSVSPEKKVYFSVGNLQCRRAPNFEWRFAPEQYQVCGEDNEKTGVWGDLFGYGTSKDPENVSTDLKDYYDNEIVGTDYDWGVWLTKNNKLPLNETTAGVRGSGKWRTLTEEEWTYLLLKRSATLCAIATIENQIGIIILPDGYKASSVTLKYPEVSEYGIEGYNGANKLTLTQWKTLEAAGAVFLPAAGYRKDAYYSVEHSYYWASTCEHKYLDMGTAGAVEMRNQGYRYQDGFTIGPGYPGSRTFGCAVRLVQDVK